MKKILPFIILLLMMLAITSCNLLPGYSDNPAGGNQPDGSDCVSGEHLDQDDDKYCDVCNEYVVVVVDFYVLNDLHGKFCVTDKQPGVDEIGTYLEKMSSKDDHIVVMSSGDMWQGTAESNLTHGNIVTEWMNELGFVSMTLGNHEFDWGQEAIRNNLAIAEFPFLAINVYDVATDTLVDYATPSVMIERGDIKIGIIGAIGDSYSSVSSDMVEGITFKVGNNLTNLVKAEADKLRAEGADLIVYSLHDGYEDSKSGTTNVSANALSSYYNSVLSSGYVDLVFEAHTHQSYTLIDNKGVYHLQGGGENQGLSHVEIEVNYANGNNKVSEAGVVRSSTYGNLADHEATEAIEDKYSDILDFAFSPLGTVSTKQNSNAVADYVAELYLEVGLDRWSDYDIVLGGGFLKTRSPYDLAAGEVTYADILSLLPFDNRIVLCSLPGHKLKSQFINTSNSSYHIPYSEYGNSVLNRISDNETYYIVVDTYTAYYKYNGLTIVDFYDENVYAR
ncbi:MAG: bifunctional metallophosphatase/5'-nucleotidase, partial [Clostridia bacterium]|nr:bifunctional metallophosphatase/5'-nucleotidase [Clostridia bacterium]